MKCKLCQSEIDASFKECPYCRTKIDANESQLDFKRILESFVEGYEGSNKEIIKLAPNVYELLTKILESNKLDSEDKLQISATIAYFILPYDFYSEEEYGPEGFSDDLLLSIHTLRRLRDKHGDEWVKSFWKHDPEQLDNLLNKYFLTLNTAMGAYFKGILDYVGLKDE